ncbi:hypothetical protein [Streptomyces sp. NPDC046332]|uniref:hypothetical protein n=1 Tax=unclassified Streptomyces TaxID=2593676 RepID=UPI0033E66506
MGRTEEDAARRTPRRAHEDRDKARRLHERILVQLTDPLIMVLSGQSGWLSRSATIHPGDPTGTGGSSGLP